MSVVTGIVKERGTSVSGIRGVWQTAVVLTHWRIDAQPIETGELRLTRGDLTRDQTTGFYEQAPAEHLVRLDAAFDADAERWVFREVIESSPTDDVELNAILHGLRHVSPPTVPSDVVVLRQIAEISDLGGEAQRQALTDEIARRTTEPWSGPDPANVYTKIHRTDTPLDHRFGTPPEVSVLVRPAAGGVTAECLLRSDPATGNQILDEFLRDIGQPAAAALGAQFTVSDDQFVVPDTKRVAPFELAAVGLFEPDYSVYFGNEHPRVSTDYHLSPVFSIPMFNDLQVRFAIWDSPLSDRGAQLAAEAINNFRAAGAEVRHDTARYVHQYYLSVRNQYDDADCIDYGIPLDLTVDTVWDHVTFRNPPSVNPEPIGYSNLLHRDIAYIDFECECSWEPEHGLQMVFIHGQRIGKVGPYDGHLTNAHASADEALLDVVFRQR